MAVHAIPHTGSPRPAGSYDTLPTCRSAVIAVHAIPYTSSPRPAESHGTLPTCHFVVMAVHAIPYTSSPRPAGSHRLCQYVILLSILYAISLHTLQQFTGLCNHGLLLSWQSMPHLMLAAPALTWGMGPWQYCVDVEVMPLCLGVSTQHFEGRITESAVGSFVQHSYIQVAGDLLYDCCSGLCLCTYLCFL